MKSATNIIKLIKLMKVIEVIKFMGLFDYNDFRQIDLSTNKPSCHL